MYTIYIFLLIYIFIKGVIKGIAKGTNRNQKSYGRPHQSHERQVEH